MSAKDTLRSNKTAILSTLCADQRLILNKVHESRLITTREYNNLKSINKEDVEGHVVELLDKILNKGETVCQDFLNILQTDEEIKSTFPELKQQLQLEEISLPKSIQVSSSNDEYMLHDNKRQKREEVYQLNTRPVGICVIINNQNFSDGSVRRGTEKDAESLAEVFSWLGFRVLMCKDQTSDQMKRTLECLSLLSSSTDLLKLQAQEWSESRYAGPQQALQHGDAFVCCILSHGQKGVVLGIDQMPVPIKHITRIFKASEQSALTGKPKMFLIQACQGGQIHKGVALTDVEADDCSTQTIPEEADILVALATVEDYPAYRHISEGSWFVQSLCQQLKERCPKGEDITTILHHVNDDVGLKEGSSRMPGAKKQMPEVRFTLRKKLKLTPY
uniref:Caspase 20, apoptosis-related cysteine peptidase n=1 Tax=Oryzias sinensis TaxID=183150 RepID=A0A8C7XHR0_9TELE